MRSLSNLELSYVTGMGSPRPQSNPPGADGVEMNGEWIENGSGEWQFQQNVVVTGNTGFGWSGGMAAGGFAGSSFAAVGGYFTAATVAEIATAIAVGGLVGSGLGLAAIAIVAVGGIIYDHYDHSSNSSER